MNRSIALFVGTVLFTSNYFPVAVDKLPDGFPNGVTIQTNTDDYITPTMVGTTSLYSGLLGNHPFVITNVAQFDELKPTFVGSSMLR